jgi:hypothetical protein
VFDPPFGQGAGWAAAGELVAGRWLQRRVRPPDPVRAAHLQTVRGACSGLDHQRLSGAYAESQPVAGGRGLQVDALPGAARWPAARNCRLSGRAGALRTAPVPCRRWWSSLSPQVDSAARCGRLRSPARRRPRSSPARPHRSAESPNGGPCPRVADRHARTAQPPAARRPPCRTPRRRSVHAPGRVASIRERPPSPGVRRSCRGWRRPPCRRPGCRRRAPGRCPAAGSRARPWGRWRQRSGADRAGPVADLPRGGAVWSTGACGGGGAGTSSASGYRPGLGPVPSDRRASWPSVPSDSDPR